MKGIANGKRLLAAGLILATAGCATVQTTQSGTVGVERKQFISSLVSEAELNQAAAQNYAQVLSQARQQKALDTDAAQTRRVKAIAQRLIGQVGVFRADASTWNWEVHVINEDEVNAWCMPGGKMAVYSGLIKRIQPTDAELAAIIGHEMAHALREHSREQVSQKMATSFGLTVLSALTGVQAVNDLGGTLSEVMFELPNSRTHESEADLIGVELAARAGYDPRAAVTLWQKMGALEQGRGQPEFLSTHPSSTTRIADLQAISERVMPLYQQAGAGSRP
ncbi:lipoprotein [Alcaligenes pakistanensis]|uniref:Lipoprotein n=1 Tax=Alcaligenes pakistanensis TaxID=1482717 RepID=A0A8H9IKT0_9BURK|nr:M48 family metallopeptidase [Alcaligenes pakistanensis]GHC36888.1 lipoprotein [Alcaligenes pakistanensis]